MPKYEVHLTVTKALKKPLTIHAADEDEAGEKAVDIAQGWEDVVSADVQEIEEV